MSEPLKKFDPASFTVRMEIPNLFGPIGRGDDGERFFKEWTQRPTGARKDIVLIGRRDNNAGCFTCIPYNGHQGGEWDICYWHDVRPSDIAGILASRELQAQYEQYYFQNVQNHKYVYMDLIPVLRQAGRW